ncbi:mitohcondrial RNA polymerase [Scheffersomyces amazonensis]|uniref:mitohcondrial RNA polymerase n=1 Tax=Scheffersomyces amazonensis TaxID=1078765 RepID=UPI00315CFFD0
MGLYRVGGISLPKKKLLSYCYSTIALATKTSVPSHSTTHSPSPFHYRPRDQSDILNSNPFDLILDEKNDSTRVNKRTINEYIIINNFLQSVFNDDFGRSRIILNKLSSRIRDSGLVNYYSCMALLVSHLLSDSNNLTIQNIKILIDELDYMHKKNDEHLYPTKEIVGLEDQIKIKLIKCLLYCFHDASQKRNKQNILISIAEYIYTNMQKYSLLKNQELIDELNNRKLLESYIHILRIMGIPIAPALMKQLNLYINEIEAVNADDDKETVAIESYMDDYGYMNLSRLCQYITDSRFTKYDKDEYKNTPHMFEIYEDLVQKDPNQAEIFYQEYIDYNKSRELNIENSARFLMENMNIIGNNSKKKSVSSNLQDLSLGGFSTSHSALLTKWLDDSVKLVIDMVKRVQAYEDDSRKKEELTEDEITVLRSIAIMNIVPKRSLMLMLISSLLSRIMISETGSIYLSTITEDFSRTFKWFLWKEKSLIPVRNELHRFLKDGYESHQLFIVLLKLVIDTCTIQLTPDQLNDLQMNCDLLNNPMRSEFKPNENGTSPAFFHRVVRIDSLKTTGIIEIHPYLFGQLKHYSFITRTNYYYFPMIYPPRPWVAPDDGAYLLNFKSIVATTEIKTSLAYLNRAHKTNQLESIYNGLNDLGKVAWAINPKVLQVFKDIMTKEVGFMKIPPSIEKLNHKDKAYHENRNRRIEMETLLNVAQAFGNNGDIIFSPHNVDFRGRAYPMSSFLNHYNDDLTRGLLMFWKSEPLGSEGFDWLKCQLADFIGKDKLTRIEKIQFINDNWEKIMDCAKSPLTGGHKIWMDADDPFQALALCFEMHTIDKFLADGGNIENYKTRISVHQDGSCNGLQHYAALGADKEAALAVNILPQPNLEDRGDIYTTMLDKVKEQITFEIEKEKEKEKENENESKPTVNNDIKTTALQILNRKVIKQTVMTSVYGVTFVGASRQISQRIKEILELHELRMKEVSLTNETINILEKQSTSVANYIANQILKSLTSLFSGAEAIQDWLTMNTIRILNSIDLETIDYALKNNLATLSDIFSLKSTFKPMMWTTLSGFPVVQLYKNTKLTRISTSLQRLTIKKRDSIASIDRIKQIRGVAPNFIHSLDSIHMLMTCLAANINHIPFVAVHDSFWTYPSRATELASILREEFIRLHSSNIIEHLREDMIYTTRNSYQIAWFEKDVYPQLTQDIEQLRSTYKLQGETPLKSRNRNSILYHELVSLTKGTTDNPLKMIEQVNPKLYFKRMKVSKMTEYGYSMDENNDKSLHLKHLTYVLVPVRILDCPPKGKLDITQVRNSPYFFS